MRTVSCFSGTVGGVASTLPRSPIMLPKRPVSQSSYSELDLDDPELKAAHKSVMARTGQKYLVVDDNLADKFITAFLIVLTVVAIIVLFLYQNFGPGIKLASYK